MQKPQQRNDKHVPMRMCIICRTRKPKEELMKISGQDGGKGAYVCGNCTAKASGIRKKANDR